MYIVTDSVRFLRSVLLLLKFLSKKDALSHIMILKKNSRLQCLQGGSDMGRSKKLILRGIKMFRDNSMPAYSGYSTLLIVTALFPFMILIISIVNLLPGYSAKDVAEIIERILPDLEPVKNLVEAMVSNLKNQSGGLLASAAAVTTLWSASRGVSAIQKGLNHLESNGQEKETPAAKGKDYLRGVLKRLLFTLMLIILIPAMLVVEMLRNSIADIICSAQDIDPEELNSTREHIDSIFHFSTLAVIAFALLVILLFYAYLPTKRRKLKSQLPGALFTVVCWVVFTELFSFFIPRFYHASSVYGSLAAVFLMLLWIRIIVMILFAGAVLNRTLEESRNQRPD